MIRLIPLRRSGNGKLELVCNILKKGMSRKRLFVEDQGVDSTSSRLRCKSVAESER